MTDKEKMDAGVEKNTEVTEAEKVDNASVDEVPASEDSESNTEEVYRATGLGHSEEEQEEMDTERRKAYEGLKGREERILKVFELQRDIAYLMQQDKDDAFAVITLMNADYNDPDEPRLECHKDEGEARNPKGGSCMNGVIASNNASALMRLSSETDKMSKRAVIDAMLQSTPLGALLKALIEDTEDEDLLSAYVADKIEEAGEVDEAKA